MRVNKRETKKGRFTVVFVKGQTLYELLNVPSFDDWSPVLSFLGEHKTFNFFNFFHNTTREVPRVGERGLQVGRVSCTGGGQEISCASCAWSSSLPSLSLSLDLLSELEESLNLSL